MRHIGLILATSLALIGIPESAQASGLRSATYQDESIQAHTRNCSHHFKQVGAWARETALCKERMTFILHRVHGQWIAALLADGKPRPGFGCEIHAMPSQTKQALGLKCLTPGQEHEERESATKLNAIAKKCSEHERPIRDYNVSSPSAYETYEQHGRAVLDGDETERPGPYGPEYECEYPGTDTAPQEVFWVE